LLDTTHFITIFYTTLPYSAVVFHADGIRSLVATHVQQTHRQFHFISLPRS